MGEDLLMMMTSGAWKGFLHQLGRKTFPATFVRVCFSGHDCRGWWSSRDCSQLASRQDAGHIEMRYTRSGKRDRNSDPERSAVRGTISEREVSHELRSRIAQVQKMVGTTFEDTVNVNPILKQGTLEHFSSH